MFRRQKQPAPADARTDAFMALVEAHEREWGTQAKRDHYADRPALKAILKAPVVAFWGVTRRRDDRYRITLHDNLEALYAYLLSFLTKRDEPTERVLRYVFVEKEAVQIVGLRLVLALAAEDEAQAKKRRR